MAVIQKSLEQRALLIVFTIVCGFLASLVDSIRQHDQLVLAPRMLWYTLVIAILFFLFVLLLERVLAWLNREPETYRNVSRKLREIFSFKTSKKRFALIAVVLVLCWLPYLIVTYPGVIWYDTEQQLLQWNSQPNTFTDGHYLSDHHPVFDTMIFGTFLRLGAFFGSADRGLYLGCIVIELVTIAALASMILYCRHIGAGWRFCFAEMIFFAVFPFTALFSMTMVKDSLFMPFFIWFAMIFVEAVRTQGLLLKHPQFFTAFLLTALLMGLTKKTGVYIVLICCIILFFAVSSIIRKRVVGVFTVVISVFMILMPKIVFPVFHIQEGGKQEMLAVPLQQSALLVKRHENDVSRQDLEVIYKILGDDVADRYQWWASDNVKGYSWDSQNDQYLGQYAIAWIHGLASHPETYVEAYVALQEAWLGIPSPTDSNAGNLVMQTYALGSDHYALPDSVKLGLCFGGFKNAVQKLQETINDHIARAPIVNLLCSRAVWSTWIFVFVLYECIRRKKRHCSWLAPYVVTFLFLWISPATVTIEGMRYLIPMVMIAPLMLGMLGAGEQTNSAQAAEDER